MKLSKTLPLLSFLSPLAHTVPNTRYSTITIIPVPLSSTVFHYHPTGSFYPSVSNSPALRKGYHNAPANISLSYTLTYPTTNLLPTPLIFAHRSALPLPLPPPPSCTPREVHCNSSTSFSLCVPGSEGGSRYVFMGAVANGTSCEGGRIVKANGGDCTPVGNLKCQGERGFFLCDEGGLMYLGSATNGTTCVDGEIFSSGS